MLYTIILHGIVPDFGTELKTMRQSIQMEDSIAQGLRPGSLHLSVYTIPPGRDVGYSIHE